MNSTALITNNNFTAEMISLHIIVLSIESPRALYTIWLIVSTLELAVWLARRSFDHFIISQLSSSTIIFVLLLHGHVDILLLSN